MRGLGDDALEEIGLRYRERRVAAEEREIVDRRVHDGLAVQVHGHPARAPARHGGEDLAEAHLLERVGARRHQH
ncbi:MAG TPA: hypothetical protein VNE71_09210, partial [Myxococcota bacterium]|nr:hypothetical protein [Myxococcota bacterium]